MWKPQPGEVYAAYQFWDTFESWNDHFSLPVDTIRMKYREGPGGFGLFLDPSWCDRANRAYFEVGPERRLPFWVRRIRAEVNGSPAELVERVRQGVTVGFQIEQKQRAFMLAASGHLRCDVPPHDVGIEVSPHPVSYEAELRTEDRGLANALSLIRGSPAEGGVWLLIRVYLDIVMRRREA